MTMSPSANQIVTRALRPGVLCTTMSGHITAPLCQRELQEFQLPEFQRVLAGVPAPERVWMIDVSKMLAFDAAAVRVGALWFDAFKDMGGGQLYFVTELSAARMAVRALGFGAGLPVHSFASREGALAALPSPRSESDARPASIATSG